MAIAVSALVATTAAASPLFAAVEHSHSIPGDQQPLQPKYAILKQGRVFTDRAAALESAQIALSRVADGSTYIWHRPSGLLSGSVKPTATFRRADGELCRHLVLELSTDDEVRAIEGVACRAPNGIWNLEG